MSNQNEIHEVELNLEEARGLVDRAKMAIKLRSNREFRKLIQEGFLRDEAARLALLSSDPKVSEVTRAHIMRDISGLGALDRYLNTIETLGNMAHQSILENEETLEQLRAEQDGVVGSDEYDPNDDEGDDE